jgi:DNA-binding XRE family transcriptional regulator
MKEKISEKTLREKLAQPLRDQYIEITNYLRKKHSEYEKGLISVDDFKTCEKMCARHLDLVEALEYRILHGPKEPFSRLIRIRKQKGLSQAEAAERAGLSLAWYALLEQGYEEKISKEKKEKVAAALDVPYDRLFRIGAWWENEPPEDLGDAE